MLLQKYISACLMAVLLLTGFTGFTSSVFSQETTDRQGTPPAKAATDTNETVSTPREQSMVKPKQRPPQFRKKKKDVKAYAFVVSTESELHKVSLTDVQYIYLGKKTLWENRLRIMPVMLRENSKTMTVFIDEVLGKTVPQYRAYWKRRLFSGGGTVPKTYKSTRALLRYLEEQPGAIGVIPMSKALKLDPDEFRIVETRK